MDLAGTRTTNADAKYAEKQTETTNGKYERMGG